MLSLDQLKSFAKALQHEVKKCQNTEPLNPAGLKGETIENLIKERDKFKQLAVMEHKRYTDAKVVLESQKRLIDKNTKGANPYAHPPILN